MYYLLEGLTILDTALHDQSLTIMDTSLQCLTTMDMPLESLSHGLAILSMANLECTHM